MVSRVVLGNTIEDDFVSGSTKFISKPINDLGQDTSAIEGVKRNLPSSNANEVIEIDGSKAKTASKTSSKGAGAARAAGSVVLAGAEILNANFDFKQIEGKARTNIMLAEFQKNEALRIGKESALREESKGFARGETAVLSAIAQGQSASGGIAQSSQLAEETFGVFNAIMVETNAIREAYGFEAQQALLESEVNIAEINRDAQVVTSLLSGAAGVATSGAF